MLLPNVLTQLMTSKMYSKQISGISVPLLCSALSEGIISSFLSSNKVITNDVGYKSAGPSAVSGKMSGLQPNLLNKLIYSGFLAKDIKGTKISDLSEAISSSLCMHFNSSNQVKGINSIIALGSGLGRVTTLNSEGMKSACLMKMKSKNFGGIETEKMCEVIAKGFCSHVLSTAIIQVTITGSPLAIPTPPFVIPLAAPGNYTIG